MVDFDFSKEFEEDDESEEDEHDKIAKKIDAVFSLKELKKLDASNPTEKAIKFEAVKKNPVEPDFMRVDVFEEVDDNGKRVAVSESKDSKGVVKRLKHDPIFSVDLNTLISADIASCPSNVMPQLLDQYAQLAVNEKKEFKPEKRKDEFNWWWIVFFLLMIPGIILVILLFL